MLSDTIRHVDLSVWPEAALVLFVGVFVLVTLRTIRSGKGYEHAMAAAALDEGSPVDAQAGKEGMSHG
ncbi:MAG: hypothetical protein ACIAS6_02505 [Phycisphaerales bacterium JB060]